MFFNRKTRSHQKDAIASPSLTLLAPQSSLPHSWKHHVFPSFHGADVRKSFLSHIIKEFKTKCIDLFIDNNIDRSKSIGPELIDAIRGSRVAIVFLSKNYASSTWCLNELVEIIKCREEVGQTVMSLFYQVDPTDVKKQTGDFGKVFRKTCKGKTKEQIQIWQHALTELAQIAGFHSTNWENEAKMIAAIASYVSNKLNLSAPSSDFDGLVGMESRMAKMEPLLQLDSDEVRKIGILGQPGIGKTTIARYIFNRYSRDFDLSVFMDNIKRKYATTACFDDYSVKLNLQKHFMSQLTNVTDMKKFSHLGVIKDRLKDKKVLVILDDVDQLVQVEAMAKETSWFGPGSLIIITTQDQRVLRASGVKYIYRVDLPSVGEALQIFCMYAFDQKYPKDDFKELAWEVVRLVGSLPLVLRVMGSYFRGMSKQDWTEALPNLRTHFDRNGEITRYWGSGEFENVNTSERASKGVSSNGLLRTVYIYCAGTVQYSFASHLSMDFHRKGICALVNCNEGASAFDGIEGASAFVVVLSKNYLSSPSCLDKLVRVLQCQRKRVQLVVPVFYGISPSDVAVQEQESDDRIRDWTSALQELTEFPGIHSREESSDCELVEEVVKDVYEKLFPTQQIGINSRLLEIKQLLCKQPWSIRRIGIWGMPGIGKTTLAKAFFDQISGRYEASCFIKHFDKAFHEKGLYRLWDEHFGKVLEKIPGVSSSITRPSLPGEEISKKRTLVVLDDVQNPLIAESFLAGFHWFGPGSLIIITSRDKQVFRLCQINHVYEVKSLDKNEALQLFSQCAFGEDIREQNLLELSMEVIDYANGNPLALSFYGSELKRKNHLEMITFLISMLRSPNMFHDLLKSSYETLNDNEKDIFLDIACFFEGDDVDYVKQVLEGCGLFPHVGIDVLVEKCLVTISENRVEMHRIIQDFGRELNNKETTWVKRGCRLWEPSTIKSLLEDEKNEANEHTEETCKGDVGAGYIKAISLDDANLLVDVKPNAFENMLNLRFLKIYCFNHENHDVDHLPKGLDSLPNGLRLLHWEYYHLHTLPQDFDPGHLVELNMPYSQLQKLWRGTKNLKMLKMVKLCHSQQLTEIDDICNAQNIENIELEGCTKLQRFPATSHLQHLRVVNLSGCREIKSFPEFSPNIEELNLQKTAIRELLISSGNATNLKTLCLRGCSSLVRLPPSIGNAISLQELNLEYCSSLVELPSSFGNATSLKKLYVTGCSSLVELPSSIGNASNLEILDLSFCSSLLHLPSSIGNATNLENLNLEYCVSLVELPSSIGNATKLKRLCLRGCSSFVKLPPSIGNAISLQELNLEYCSSLVELPSSFGNATNLKKLYLTGCSSLDEIPSSIRNSTSLISIDLNDDNSPPVVTVSDNSGSRCVEVRRTKGGEFYVLEGEQMNENSVSLNFHFLYENERPRSYVIPFYQNDDTANTVSSWMVEQLKLTDHVTFIAELIDIVLANLIPDWKTDVPVDYIIHSHLNQNSKSHRNKGKIQREEESVFQDTMSVSRFSWNSESTRLEEVSKQCADEIDTTQRIEKMPHSFKMHYSMCLELKNLVDRVMRIFPEIEAARPGSTTWIQTLCLLNKALEKSKLLLQYCSESSKIYMAVTGDAILKRGCSAKKLLEQSLADIRTMVPTALAIKILEVLQDLKSTELSLESSEEEAGKAIRDLMRRSTSPSVSSDEIRDFHFAALNLQLSTPEAIVIERRSLKSLYGKLGECKGNARQILKYLLCLLKKHEKIIWSDHRENSLRQHHSVNDYVSASVAEAGCSEEHNATLPEQFKCTLSLTVMYDPVIISSGHTFERMSIQRWFDLGNDTCPVSKTLLDDFTLQPNVAMKDQISKWCKKHGLDVQDPAMNHTNASQNLDFSIASFTSSLYNIPDLSCFTSRDFSSSFSTDSPSYSRISRGGYFMPMQTIASESGTEVTDSTHYSEVEIEPLCELSKLPWNAQSKVVQDVRSLFEKDSRAVLNEF